jgi:hypothetical protein
LQFFYFPNQGAGATTHVISDSPTIIWPVDTNLVFINGETTLKLTHQPTVLRLVIKNAIDNLKGSIVFTDAFPDYTLTIKFAKSALISATMGQLSTAQGIHTWLMNDDDYVSGIIPLVCNYDIQP